LMVPPG